MSSISFRNFPLIAGRGVHLDLKGTPPTFSRLLSLLDDFSVLRYNLILVEWEDSFPWSVAPSFRSPTAYSEDEVRQFVEKAERLGLELVPLVQTLGHMENFLKGDRYAFLRERPDGDETINPLAPEAVPFVQSLILDVLRLMPQVKRFHLGGDEAWAPGYAGGNPAVQAFFAQHGPAPLYLQHMGALLPILEKKQIRPMLWHDMMVDWEVDHLRQLSGRADLLVWAYNGDSPLPNEALARFVEAGFTIWGATAYKGADGVVRDRPNSAQRLANCRAWVEAAQSYGLVGVITTGWSRYTYHSPQCESIEAAWDVVVAHAKLLYDGSFPDDLRDYVDEWIDQRCDDEGASRYRMVLKAAQGYHSMQNDLWERVRTCRVQLATTQGGNARRDIPNYRAGVPWALKRLANAEAEYRAALKGLVEEIWLEEYFEVRQKALILALRLQ
jgi:hypothetical protein